MENFYRFGATYLIPLPLLGVAGLANGHILGHGY